MGGELVKFRGAAGMGRAGEVLGGYGCRGGGVGVEVEFREREMQDAGLE